MNTLTLILPNSAISAIIGHGGNIIKMMQETTRARIKVENRMDHVSERVVRISSTDAENVYHAFKKVLDKINGDPQLRINMHVTYMHQQPTNHTKSATSRYQQIDADAIRKYFERLLASGPRPLGSIYNGVSVRPVGTKPLSRSVTTTSTASDPRSSNMHFHQYHDSSIPVKKRKFNEATAN
jgi:hypothetical protein